MTLADILKPSLAIVIHAEAKGSHVGAAVGLLLALPALSFSPDRFNPYDAPPLVAIARVAGVCAVAGASVAVATSLARLVQMPREGIVDRASKLSSNLELVTQMRVACGGASMGLALMALRIWKIAEANRTSVASELFSCAALWDLYCFAAMGASISIGGFKAIKLVSKKMTCAGGEGCGKGKGKGKDSGSSAMDKVGEEAQKLLHNAKDEVEKTDKKVRGGISEALSSKQ